MSQFVEVSAAQWDAAVTSNEAVSVFMQSAWEKELERVLPFVQFQHYRYDDTHLVRVTKIAGRLTTAPFAEGGDVVATTDTTLDIPQFTADVQARFGARVRLRINERVAPVTNDTEAPVVAYEHVVSLTEPILPRVRKTLRHVLKKPPEGTIETTTLPADLDAAYRLYVAHMRRVQNFALSKELFRSLVKNPDATLWVWRYGGRVRAMALFLKHGGEALYSLSAADAFAFSHHAPQHLVYTALETYRTDGLSCASLGATGVGSPLAVFKRGWRGEQHVIYEVGSRALGVGRNSRARGLVRYVPLVCYSSLTRWIGKYFM